MSELVTYLVDNQWNEIPGNLGIRQRSFIKGVYLVNLVEPHGVVLANKKVMVCGNLEMVLGYLKAKGI